MLAAHRSERRADLTTTRRLTTLVNHAVLGAHAFACGGGDRARLVDDADGTSELSLELGLDYVRGTLADSGDPLPRIPPLRMRGGLRYQHNAFQGGGELIAAAMQDRVFLTETPTDGYQLLRLFGAYSIARGSVVHTITARLDNATDALYRNHLSLIKDLAPEMGRNAKLLYSVKF